jgi:hypothetical protein
LAKNYFAELESFTLDPATVDAVNEWLSYPLWGIVVDSISWWTAMEMAGHPLAQMSLDILSTPAMLLFVKRLM